MKAKVGKVFGVWICALLMWQSLAPGQLRAEESPVGPRAEVKASTLSGEQINGDKGEHDYYQTGVSFSYQPIRLSFENRVYNWDEAKLRQLPFGNGRDDPWKHLRSLEVSAGKELRLDQDWSCFLELGALAAYEDSFGGFGGKLRGWGGYDLSPDLRARAGGRLYAYQAGIGTIIPELALDYKLDNPSGLSASLGIPDAHLKYAFSPRAALRLAAWLDRDTYRLAEDSTVRRDGYLENSRYLGGLFLDLRPFQDLRLSLGLTRSLDGTMTTFDKDGDNSKEYDLEGTWGGALSLDYRF